jgi:hypothetical protein
VVVHTEVRHSLPRLSLRRPDEQSSRLPAAEVAACGLRALERCQQPLCERPVCRRVSVGHRLPDGPAAHVRLHGEALTYEVAGVRDAFGPRVHSHVALRVHDRDLADRRIGIGGREPCERLLGRLAGAEKT